MHCYGGLLTRWVARSNLSHADFTYSLDGTSQIENTHDFDSVEHRYQVIIRHGPDDRARFGARSGHSFCAQSIYIGPQDCMQAYNIEFICGVNDNDIEIDVGE